MAKDVIRLSAEARAPWTAVMLQGQRAASVLTRARMRRKGDAAAGGSHGTAPAMADAVETRCSTPGRASGRSSSRRAWRQRGHASRPRGDRIATARASQPRR